MKPKRLTVTVDEGLRALDSSLVITVLQKSTISKRHSEIDRVVIKGFDALGTVLPGAFARNTMIQPLENNEIDLYVLLRPEVGRLNTPGGLMHRLLAVIHERYPEAKIGTGGIYIVIKYPEFVFHVTPSFQRHDKGYILADAKNQKWVRTNPNEHYYALDDANSQHQGLLVPVIRIIKHWNHCNGFLFNDYYLELLIKETMSDIKSSAYSQAIKYFFGKAIHLLVFTIDDPADYGKQMEGLKDIDKMLEAMQSFKNCHDHIVKAEKYGKQGDLLSMYKEWGKIFAGNFPSYVDMMADKLEANGITGVEALKMIRDAT